MKVVIIIKLITTLIYIYIYLYIYFQNIYIFIKCSEGYSVLYSKSNSKPSAFPMKIYHQAKLV